MSARSPRRAVEIQHHASLARVHQVVEGNRAAPSPIRARLALALDHVGPRHRQQRTTQRTGPQARQVENTRRPHVFAALRCLAFDEFDAGDTAVCSTYPLRHLGHREPHESGALEPRRRLPGREHAGDRRPDRLRGRFGVRIDAELGFEPRRQHRAVTTPREIHREPAPPGPQQAAPAPRCRRTAAGQARDRSAFPEQRRPRKRTREAALPRDRAQRKPRAIGRSGQGRGHGEHRAVAKTRERHRTRLRPGPMRFILELQSRFGGRGDFANRTRLGEQIARVALGQTHGVRSTAFGRADTRD